MVIVAMELSSLQEFEGIQVMSCNLKRVPGKGKQHTRGTLNPSQDSSKD
jgi:hypothetical protein